MTQPSTHGATPASSGRTPAQGNRLDPWYDVYADRALNLRASEIRALFSVVSRPEVVSLAGGMPNLKDLPLDRLAASAEKLIRNHGAQAMQYGNGQGWEVLRERITEVMAYDGIVGADPDDVVVTTGSQQALDLVTELFVNPGDVILAEAPRTWARWASSAPARRTSCTSPWMSTASFPRPWLRRSATCAPRVAQLSSSTSSRTTTTRRA